MFSRIQETKKLKPFFKAKRVLVLVSDNAVNRRRFSRDLVLVSSATVRRRDTNRSGRITTVGGGRNAFSKLGPFTEAPEYRNGKECASSQANRANFASSSSSSNDPSPVHIAMTLDSEYLRGSIAAVHSVLRHASCPENVFFHFIAAEFDSASPRVLSQLVRSTFPSLSFKVYIFREDTVINLISSSIRQALENPLNYARNYLGDILDRSVDRVIYLDSDVIVVDDVTKLWNTVLTGTRVIGAPEYCHANFSQYFTSNWSDPVLPGLISGRKPCYFNTG
ncbi:hypothetical protein Bca52824_072552 [Brassica carinata]|uniref:Hexosyltransferase n=1 Tax=Brassica carinata TaxID=52824 RepID=A0A8X7QCC2_BRACI|nr:hypothetical protein Bca52824_072552 [Brassica carinata]